MSPPVIYGFLPKSYKQKGLKPSVELNPWFTNTHSMYIYVYMSNIIPYLLVLIHTYPVKISIILILKYYSDDIIHKSID